MPVTGAHLAGPSVTMSSVGDVATTIAGGPPGGGLADWTESGTSAATSAGIFPFWLVHGPSAELAEYHSGPPFR